MGKQTIKQAFIDCLNEKERQEQLKSFDRECTYKWKSLIEKRIDIWLKHNLDTTNKKEENKHLNRFFGIPFEYYIVERMGISDSPWCLVSWRSDKFIQARRDNTETKTFPKTNSFPDLVYEYGGKEKNSDFIDGDRIAIECKWHEEKPKTISTGSYCKNALMDGACYFYLAIGIGWDDKEKEPKNTYLIPASAIGKINNNNIDKYEWKKGDKPNLNASESLISPVSSDNIEDIKNIITKREKQVCRLLTCIDAQFVKFEESADTYEECIKANATAADVDFTFQFTVESDSDEVKLIKEAAGDSLVSVQLPKDNNFMVTKDVVNDIVQQILDCLPEDYTTGTEMGINLAGNNIKILEKHGINQPFLDVVMVAIAKLLSDKGVNITSWRSGGQTGIEESVVAIGKILKVPSIVSIPKDYAFCDVSGIIVNDEMAFKARFNRKNYCAIQRLVEDLISK